MSGIPGALFRGSRAAASLALACLLVAVPAAAQSAPETGLPGWLATLDSALARVESLARSGDGDEASRILVRSYLDQVEPIEGFYGPGGPHEAPGLTERVVALEAAFHARMRATDPAELAAAVPVLRAAAAAVLGAARQAGVPMVPGAPLAVGTAAPAAAAGEARSPEIAEVVAGFDAARSAYDAGDRAGALALVERTYLERFELLEPLLPGASVRRVESLIHLHLRPRLAKAGADPEIAVAFDALRAELLVADAAVADGTPFWFAAVNSFAIIVREGLEAVLLVGALLAYLVAIGAERRHVRQIWLGVGLGIGVSLATWVVARMVIPVSGAHRELLEGVTALVAVGVLLYVSHWLFQKAYIHDWKAYLRERVGQAVSGGSALAMAGLAFAAVYREGFETVLFYQAMLFDAPPGAVVAGFVPGAILIVIAGVAIVRLGVRLPLKKVFAVTNTLLLYLAFVFLGKGLYNLQEGGLFSPLPLHWLPDSPALQQLLGFYPVAQTVLAQAALLGVLIVTWAIHRRRIAAAARQPATAPSAAPPATIARRPARTTTH